MNRKIPRITGLVLILGTVAAGPFFQGLFLPHQQHVAQTSIGLGFVGFVCWLLATFGPLDSPRLTVP